MRINAPTSLLTQQHGVSLLRCDSLRPADDVREELVREVGDHEPDGVGSAPDETPGDDVGAISQLRCGAEDAFASVGGDASRWVLRQDKRDERLRNAGA